MIISGAIQFNHLAQNGCTPGQVPQWDGSAWVCASATGVSAHGLLSGLLADDHPQYFNLGQNEIVTGTPSFNGGVSGSTPPFTVSSSTVVTDLNADLLDGLPASAFIRQGQADSITTTMIISGAIQFNYLAQNGCTPGQVPQWDGSAWVCASATGVSAHGLLSGLLADDHPQYFNLGQNEIVTGTPSFNGGVSGSTPPFTVSSSTVVTDLNADLLDGLPASSFRTISQTNATLTAGTGLSGGSYDGSVPATFSVTYGTAAGTAVQGNQTATITAGNGLSGGISGDALGNGFAATLTIGPLAANWNQTGAYDVVLNNAGSELQMLEATGGAYYGTFDVGDLSANQTYNFTTGGTVWTSGNDGAGSGLDADLLDGQQASAFAASAHTHQTLTAGNGLSGGSYNGGTAITFNIGPLAANWNQTGAYDVVLNNAGSELQMLEATGGTYYGTFDVGDLSANQTYSFTTGGTVWTSGNDGAGSGLDADLLDGQQASAFAASAHTHQTLTAGNGLSGGSYNGGTAITFNIGPLAANWNQTGAYDVVLNNAGSELQMLEATGGTYYGTFDVGDLSANQTYSFTTGGTVWTSGNDGAGSGLDADLLDGQHAAGFWNTTGNAGTNPTTNYLGTSDNVTLTLGVNGTAALRIAPNAASPNLLGGYSGNWISPTVAGAVIAGGGASGNLNRVTDNYGVVGGGFNNQAGDNAGTAGDRQHAVVAGGNHNTASGSYSTVAGGQENTASGAAATVAGGYRNVAAGNYSFAAGYQTNANANGCFTWGDSTAVAAVNCNVANAWVARASGGVTFYTNAGMTIGARLPAGSGSWGVVSDRNLKANFQPVDTQAVLQKVAAMPVSTWNYISQDEAVRHIGPMAQDFAAAFGVGEDDKHITTIDADGVALAAIQGLYAENQALKAETASQQAQIAAVQQQNAELAARLAALEQSTGLRPAPAANFWLPALAGAALVLLAAGLGLAAALLLRRGPARE